MRATTADDDLQLLHREVIGNVDYIIPEETCARRQRAVNPPIYVGLVSHDLVWDSSVMLQ